MHHRSRAYLHHACLSSKASGRSYGLGQRRPTPICPLQAVGCDPEKGNVECQEKQVCCDDREVCVDLDDEVLYDPTACGESVTGSHEPDRAFNVLIRYVIFSIIDVHINASLGLIDRACGWLTTDLNNLLVLVCLPCHLLPATLSYLLLFPSRQVTRT